MGATGKVPLRHEELNSAWLLRVRVGLVPQCFRSCRRTRSLVGQMGHAILWESREEEAKQVSIEDTRMNGFVFYARRW